jgi:hypothetical protein
MLKVTHRCIEAQPRTNFSLLACATGLSESHLNAYDAKCLFLFLIALFLSGWLSGTVHHLGTFGRGEQAL